MREKIEKVLDEDVRPFLQSHGGDVELVEVSEDGVVKVKLTGGCAGCPMAWLTITGLVERAIKVKIPEIKKVEAV